VNGVWSVRCDGGAGVSEAGNGLQERELEAAASGRGGVAPLCYGPRPSRTPPGWTCIPTPDCRGLPFVTPIGSSLWPTSLSATARFDGVALAPSAETCWRRARRAQLEPRPEKDRPPVARAAWVTGTPCDGLAPRATQLAGPPCFSAAVFSDLGLAAVLLCQVGPGWPHYEVRDAIRAVQRVGRGRRARFRKSRRACRAFRPGSRLASMMPSSHSSNNGGGRGMR